MLSRRDVLNIPERNAELWYMLCMDGIVVWWRGVYIS